jgi:phenylalanyl-tRNA synthetase alpha chain
VDSTIEIFNVQNSFSLVTDYGLTVGDLKGTIRAFFSAIGITRLRFKPAYNPYTEPSMEIFGFHPELGKW